MQGSLQICEDRVSGPAGLELCLIKDVIPRAKTLERTVGYICVCSGPVGPKNATTMKTQLPNTKTRLLVIRSPFPEEVV
jgi:hypothetical protein